MTENITAPTTAETDGIATPDEDGTEAGKPKGRYMVGGAVAACAVCCAPPVLALVGIAGGGALATGATFAFAGLAFAIVVAAITVGAFIIRKRTPRQARPHTATRPDSLEQSGHGPSPLPDPVRRSSNR